MKKLESVYILEIRLFIFKFLIFITAMTFSYVIAFYVKGMEFAGYGFDFVCKVAGFDKINTISFLLLTILLIVSTFVNHGKIKNRYKLIPVSLAEITIMSILAFFTLYLLWYAFTILDIFLVAWLFEISPVYSGGPQGILYSFIVSAILRDIVPISQPIHFLGNVARLVPASILICLPQLYILSSAKEGKKHEEK